MTIRAKLVLLCSLSVLTTSGFCIRSYQAANEVMHGVKMATTFTSAMRNHMTADMMHDAIRGDVYAGMIAGSAEERDAARAALEDHGTILSQSIRADEALPLSAAIKKDLLEAEPTLAAYLPAARRQASGTETGPEALRAVMEAFHQLEAQLEKVGP